MPLMVGIHTRANRVVIWPGEAADDSDETPNTLRLATENPHNDWITKDNSTLESSFVEKGGSNLTTSVKEVGTSEDSELSNERLDRDWKQNLDGRLFDSSLSRSSSAYINEEL